MTETQKQQILAFRQKYGPLSAQNCAVKLGLTKSIVQDFYKELNRKEYSGDDLSNLPSI
jgi:hypothetical protein